MLHHNKSWIGKAATGDEEKRRRSEVILMWSVKNSVSNRFNWKKFLISRQDICIRMKSQWHYVARSRFVNFYVNWRLIPKTASLSSFFLLIYLIYMEHNYAIIYDIKSQPFVYTIRNNYLLTEFFSTHLQVDAFGEIKIRVSEDGPQKIQWNGKLASKEMEIFRKNRWVSGSSQLGWHFFLLFPTFSSFFLREAGERLSVVFSNMLRPHDGSVAEHSWFGLFK